jgi:hypothetical protein
MLRQNNAILPVIAKRWATGWVRARAERAKGSIRIPNHYCSGKPSGAPMHRLSEEKCRGTQKIENICCMPLPKRGMQGNFAQRRIEKGPKAGRERIRLPVNRPARAAAQPTPCIARHRLSGAEPRVPRKRSIFRERTPT